MGESNRYVDQWVDGDLGPLDLGDLIEAKFDEIVSLGKSFKWAVVIPRRLGGDATAQELSRDKKVLRKLIYLYTNLTERWALQGILLNMPATEPSPADQRFGAQVVLTDWIRAQEAKLDLDRIQMATAASQKGDRRAANKVLACLDQEAHSLARVREKFYP